MHGEGGDEEGEAEGEDELHEEGQGQEQGGRAEPAVGDEEDRGGWAGPSRKWTRLVSTVTTGRTSAGKSTFLMRLPPAMSTPEDSRSEALNQVQGRIPQKKKRA